MPLYEYKCRGCGKKFEVLQRFSDQPVKVHEACGGAVERLISPPTFRFKGSGFYITDYAKGHDKNGGQSRESKKESKSADTPTAPKPVESKPSSGADSSPKA